MKLIRRLVSWLRRRRSESRSIADLAQASNHQVESFCDIPGFCDIPADLRMLCLAFLSPRDLFLGYGLTSKDHRDQSRAERLTQFSPLVRFRVKRNETLYDLTLRMLSTLRHAFRGSRNKLEVLGLNKMSLTEFTDTELQELTNALRNNPLLGMNHIKIPEQHIPRPIAGRISEFVHFMLTSATNLESYECHTIGTRIVYLSMWNNHGRLKSFRCDNSFLESTTCAFNLCGTAISEVSLENGLFLAGFSLSRTNLEDGSRECFLCKDHVHLETVNIAGAKCISVMIQTGSGQRLLTKPVPQSILMDFVRMNKNLRWIQCDLTPANVAVIKAERPKLTFVSSHLEM